MKSHRIAGGAGVGLHVVEAGNPAGRTVIFLHGFSQSHLVWRYQLQSALADEFRLIAFDLRGHGLSDRPPLDAYADLRQWADDVQAVVRFAGADRPLICAWSYGTAVMGDYLRLYGESGIGGIAFVGGFPGPDEVTPLWKQLVPGVLSQQVDESLAALSTFIRYLVHRPLTAEEQFLLLGLNMAVSPAVRAALLRRPAASIPLPALSRPVWLAHGLDDRLVHPASDQRVQGLCADVRRSWYPAAGHALFWDQTESFNAELASFARSLSIGP